APVGQPRRLHCQEPEVCQLVRERTDVELEAHNDGVKCEPALQQSIQPVCSETEGIDEDFGVIRDWRLRQASIDGQAKRVPDRIWQSLEVEGQVARMVSGQDAEWIGGPQGLRLFRD